MKQGTGGARLTPEWRRWVVENLLRGAEAQDLVAVLEGAGVDAHLASETVRAEQQDPCLEGALRALTLNRKLEGLLDLYGDLYRQAEGHARVERHESLSREAFFDGYYFQNRPVVLKGTVVDTTAAWLPERLSALLARHGGHEGTPSSRSVLLGNHVELLESLRPPGGFVVAEGRALLTLEAEGFESPELPVRQNVLLCQVHGRRRLRLVPAFELRRMAGEPSEAEAVLRLEVELGPGELVLLPVGWWCGYEVLEASTSVSFRSFAACAPNVSWEQEPAPPQPTPPPWHRAG